jgi:hypothetical protein
MIGERCCRPSRHAGLRPAPARVRWLLEDKLASEGWNREMKRGPLEVGLPGAESLTDRFPGSHGPTSRQTTEPNGVRGVNQAMA